jgi:DedD protein
LKERVSVSEGLKQRIAGTIVLGVLGIIFLPLLIDFADPIKVDRSSKIPPVPKIKPVTIEKAKRPSTVTTQDNLQSPCHISKLKPANFEEDPYGVAANNIPVTWYLQVGSFSDPEKSKELKVSLREAGFKVFSEQLSVAGEPRERVLVGPKLDRQRVMDAKSTIDKDFGVDSDVLSCRPQEIEDS